MRGKRIENCASRRYNSIGMARKKRSQFPKFSLPSVSVSLAPETRRMIISILCVAVGLILVLAFWGIAGPVGNALRIGFAYLVGDFKALIPLTLFVLAILFARRDGKDIREMFYFTMVVGICLMLVSFLGLIDLFFPDHAGIVGRAMASLEYLFGFWASVVALSAVFCTGFLMDFWELVTGFLEKRKLVLYEAHKQRELIELPREEKIKQESRMEPKERNAQIPVVQLKKQEQAVRMQKIFGPWEFPPLDLLSADGAKPSAGDIRVYAQIIQRTLEDFSIPVEMGSVHVGPTVTQYTLKPAQGVKLAHIVVLQNDLALALAAHPIRIEAPIPGQSLVGIEVPNKTFSIVRLRSLLEDLAWKQSSASLLVPLGRNVKGEPVFTDIAKLPHLLVAGATGTGKSIFIHSALTSLMYRNPPQLLKFILVDPKRVELTAYDGIPYLLSPVITDGRKAIVAMKWAITEMDRRYDLLLEEKCRDTNSFNAKPGRKSEDMLPSIAIVIDELADLMVAHGKELEGIIVRLAQMARATGIHLIVSTQRPSVEVITGLIKANITSRVAFQVASQVDSRTILDGAGAEKLLGRGDALFISAETSKPKRIQAPFISEEEVERVVSYIKHTAEKIAFNDINAAPDLVQMLAQDIPDETGISLLDRSDDDELYDRAYSVVVKYQKASASLLQRYLRVGYARAARLLDMLEARGVIGPGHGAKPRDVYMQANEAEMDALDQRESSADESGKMNP
ncbi:MAG: hypothetical protein COZ64_00450 [Candidatus Brennerbacteria bacterium CG_4_8_14_3_um_filter_43_14]|uniref:FtsK domain-containing protein n=1 Tax=Candidatus Brennerbacteria bacterium CG_4_8_14_3_um_filter_43_14 TaxID=1974521 RepID=A0A2H9N5Y6_9BACT|nr:MAG: hypothetical protein COZ64_00450 [Candidatus Brennerbacteria bacterium CG_4_8_14_3_um_filter_43_14]